MIGTAESHAFPVLLIMVFCRGAMANNQRLNL